MYPSSRPKITTDSSTTGSDMILDHPPTNNHSMPPPSLAAFRAFKIQKASKTDNPLSRNFERPHMAPVWRDRRLRCTEAIATGIAAKSTAPPRSPIPAPSSSLRSSTSAPQTTTKAWKNRVPCYQGHPIPRHLVSIIQPDGSIPTLTLDQDENVDDDAPSESPTCAKRSRSRSRPTSKNSNDSNGFKCRCLESNIPNQQEKRDDTTTSRSQAYADRWCSTSALAPSSCRRYKRGPRPTRIILVDDEDLDDNARSSSIAPHPEHSRSTSASSSSSSNSFRTRHRRERSTMHEDELDDDTPSSSQSRAGGSRSTTITSSTPRPRPRFPTVQIYTYIWGGLHSQLYTRLITKPKPFRSTPDPQPPTYRALKTHRTHQVPIHNDAINALMKYREALEKWDEGLCRGLAMEGYKDDVKRRKWFLVRRKKGLKPEERVREERRWRGRGFKEFR